MKAKMKSKALAILMSMAMVFTMIPMMGAPVYADDPEPAAICLANGTAPNITGGRKDNIYFGHYPQSEVSDVEGLTKDVDYIKADDKNYLIEPIKWCVLDNPVDENGNLLDELLLLSDQSLDCRKYNEIWTDMTWKDSTIRAWLNGTSTKGGTPCTDIYQQEQNEQTFDYKDDNFIGAAFSSDEREAIKYTGVKNKNTEKYTPNPYYNDVDGGNDTVDRIFLLSINDVQNDAYAFTENYGSTTTREAKNTDYAAEQGAWTYTSGQYYGNGYWWLRSPGSTNDSAVVVHGNGYLFYYGDRVDYVNYAVRPAFNLNLSSAIFTSAAVGGKSSGAVGAGSLQKVGTNETNEWKMTVKDKAHKDFKVESVSTCDGKTLKIKYSGVVAKEGEYISAIITDQFDDIKYYGNLIEFADGDSTQDIVKVTIDGKMESTDKLYVFNEQLNGDKKTDFSSPLQKITIPTELHDWKAATCTEAKICKECGVTDGNPLGHKYGAWAKLNATQHQRVCEYDDTHVEKENHKWDAGKETRKATEKEAGTKTFTCTVCKATKTETIPKLKPSTPKVSGTPLAKMTAGKKSLTIGWNKIKGVAGYDIFFAQCNHKHKKYTCKKVKKIKGNKTFVWKKSGLKKGRAYKVYVKAYVYKDGKKKYVSKSPLMHAYTGNGTKKYTNAKSVTIRNVKKGKLSLKKGRTFKIKAKVNKVSKKKKLMPKSHAPKLRYMTSDKKIATVSSKGKIKAKAKGKCYIYAYAHNGVSKKVTVIVK